MKKIKLATVFSGIGSVEQSLIKMNIPSDIVFACDNGERYIDLSNHEIKQIKDKLRFLNLEEQTKLISDLYKNVKKKNLVKETYFANYDISLDKWFEDIRFIDGTKFRNEVDLLVGGSPCQSFSIIGKKEGLNDSRGFLFFEFARLISEIKPKVFIYENVLGMLQVDKGKSWEEIERTFHELGYKIYGPMILNAIDYGIPQNRKRLFVVGFLDKSIKFNVPKPVNHKIKLDQFLDKKAINPKHYLGEKGFKFVTNPKYRNRARVASEFIKTQKANQQFNWNGDFIFEEFDPTRHNEAIRSRAYLGQYNGKSGYIRQLTYRECGRLMGFPDSFKYSKNNVAAYRQFGNSIVVNVIEAIVSEIVASGAYK